MKKIFTLAAIAAVAFSFALTSCSKSAADYKAEAESLQKEMQEAVKAGDEAKIKELTEKANALEKEIREKAEADPEFKKECEDLGAKF